MSTGEKIFAAIVNVIVFFAIWFFISTGCDDSKDNITQIKKIIIPQQTQQTQQTQQEDQNVKTKNATIVSGVFLDSFAGIKFGKKFNVFGFEICKQITNLFFINWGAEENRKVHMDCIDVVYKTYYPKIDLPGADEQYVMLTPITHMAYGVILKAKGDHDKHFSEWHFLLERKYGKSEITSYNHPRKIRHESIYQFENGKIFLQRSEYDYDGTYIIAVNTDIYQEAVREYREKLNSTDITGL